MDFNKVCPHCMNQISEGVCSYCKKDPREMPKERYYLRPFTILQGKYLVGGVRVEYGFMIIYNGMDIKRQMPVIIKEFYPKEFVTREAMISPRVNMNSNANIEIIQKWREGFLGEAKQLAGFAHLPSVVSVKDFFEENNTLYMVMECLDGEYLKNFIESRGGRISAEEIIKYMEPVIQDLNEVHKQGYIHASISPNEFMLLEDGTMKLFAFDRAISFKEKDEKKLSVLINTGYSPKEQYLTREKKGPWTDVYAICAIIYRCITGVTPLDSMERLIEDKMKWPTEMGISIDANFENILKKGMSVLAENRIQNMQHLYDAIYLSNTYSAGKCVEGAMPVKFVSIVGDSISTYEGYNPQGYAVFYNEEMQKENGLKSVYDTWWAKVNQALHGFLCVNNSYSGSKVSGKDFPAAVSEQRMNMLKTKEFSPDYILIYIGFNDFGNGVQVSKIKNRIIWRADYNVFEDSYDLMLQKIISRNPGTKIICGTIMRTKIKGRDDWEFPEYYAGIGLEDYNDAIRRVAKKNNCMVADISRLGMRYETLDGSHPTVNGHTTIADAWIRCLDELNLLETSIETCIN